MIKSIQKVALILGSQRESQNAQEEDGADRETNYMLGLKKPSNKILRNSAR